MPIPLKPVITVATITALSACGGGGSSGSTRVVELPEFIEEGGGGSESLTAYNELQISFAGLDPTPAVEMPTSTTATYQGYAGHAIDASSEFDVLTNPQMISDASLTVDFGAGTLTGTLSDFEDRTGGKVAGEIEIFNGIINGNEIIGRTTGSLDVDGDSVAFAGTIAGGFGGEEAEAIGIAGGAQGLRPDESIVNLSSYILAE